MFFFLHMLLYFFSWNSNFSWWNFDNWKYLSWEISQAISKVSMIDAMLLFSVFAFNPIVCCTLRSKRTPKTFFFSHPEFFFQNRKTVIPNQVVKKVHPWGAGAVENAKNVIFPQKSSYQKNESFYINRPNFVLYFCYTSCVLLHKKTKSTMNVFFVLDICYLHYMLNHTCWKRHLPYWHNYYTPKLKRPKPLRKVFEKSTISRQNYPPNSNGTDPCEKAHLSLGGGV